jgi:hypothetical protein
MLTPSWPIGIRAFPAQLLRDIEPVAAIAAANDHPERNFVSSLSGRSVSALVLGRADDGSGIVDIDGHHVTVAADLPPPGARVILKFSADLPLPAPGATLAAQASTPSASQQAGAATPPAAARGGVLVELHADAVSLGKVAQAPLQPLQLGAVAASVDHPGDWAQALAGMLRDSGTFYESHLAAWTRGSYPLQDLQREPQASARPPAADNPAGNRLLPGTAATGTALIHSPAGTPVSATEARMAAAPAAGAATTGAVPDQWRPVVREQLHTLETQSLPFSVDVWPGQRGDLVIGRQEQETGSRDSRTPAGWKTTLKLQLPQLGNIAATLSLSGDRLWLDLAAPAASAERLDEATSALGTALRAAGIELVRTRIQDDAP